MPSSDEVGRRSIMARSLALVTMTWLGTACFRLTAVSGHPHEEDVKVNLDHETNLYFHVLDDHRYIKHLRPAVSHNESVMVDVEIGLTAVHGLGTSTGILETTVRLRLKWQDPRLTWNKTAFSGLGDLSVPVSELWSPDLTLLNSDQNSFQTSTGKHANVRFDGTVTWLCDVLVRSLCPVDLSYFPFDAQMCTLKFGSSTSLDESLHFHMSQTPPGSIPGVTRDRIDTTLAGEWVLVENKLTLTDSAHDVEMAVHLMRRSQLHQCLVVGPVVLLALLVPCVFLIPADSPAKICLGALLQVSICICLRTLSGMIQTNLGSVPKIAIFSIATLALSSISIIMAAIVMSLTSRGTTRKAVPTWLTTIFLGPCGLRRWLCMDQYIHVQRQLPFASQKNGHDLLEGDADASSLKENETSSETRDITRSFRQMLGHYFAEQAGGEWREIARVVDRLLFLVFVVLFMLTSISLLS